MEAKAGSFFFGRGRPEHIEAEIVPHYAGEKFSIRAVAVFQRVSGSP